MITIRKRQMAAFAEVETNKFVDSMVVHLRKFFPKQCEAMGEPQVRDTIRHGINRAATYGITAKSDVYKYVDLMVVFGRDFDTDKEFPWAGEILQRRDNSGRKASQLIEVAKQHLGGK